MAHGLDPGSRPTLEELQEGRDIELCAFSPVSDESVWERLPLREGALQPRTFFVGPRLDTHLAPSCLNYP